MFYLKYIKSFYLFLTVLAIVSPVNFTLLEFIPSIVFVWVIIIFFCVGIKLAYHGKMLDKEYKGPNNEEHLFSTKRYVLFCGFCLIFIPIYIKFYTGSSLLTNLSNLSNSLGADSNYSQYQTYFNESNIGTFSLSKLPLIILNGVLKFYLFIYIISLVSYTKKPELTKVISLLMSAILYFTIGMSRGTSFELFEIIIILGFSLLLRFTVLYDKNWIAGKVKWSFYLLTFLSVIYFTISKSLRSDGKISFSDITSSFKFNPDSFFYLYFEMVALLAHNLSGYFLFGMYFISNSINYIWFSSFEGGVSTLLPSGVDLLGLGDSYIDILCGKVIDCGAAWVPDSMVFIDKYGIVIFVIFIIVLGYISYKSFIYAKQGSLKHALTLFLIVLFMFSLPIGNFISASSATQIVVLLTVAKFIFPFNLFDKKI